MNDMRKLMEAVEQLTEGWDVEGIADVIYDEIRDVNSPVRKAYDESNEPFRGAIYTYGQLSGLFNPEAIDGSEIYHKIVDRLEAKVAGLQEDEDDDGDVPSRRVSDEELLAKVESKINDALKAIAMGLKAEKVGESKVLAIQLRRDLKELKAFIESGGDALGLRAKLHLAFVKAEKLADYSYEYDDVLWELNDADNLLYLHLSGRPVAIDEEGTDGKRIDYPESWEEKFHRIAKDQHERELYNICADDEMNALLQGELEEASCPCGKEGCECGPDCDCEPVEEGFSLDSIVESLLDERGQPKDYEMSDDELTAEIEDETSEFERDHIDKEIEDEELGLRFD
jgi:hypothetical protein